ncbi:methyltransferase domain-containing protein [Segetibacter sp. 3557_3]|uniref:class I SAM-dependent methyltransferase n=1 Tax=Segetibacter sp. 3557_3 TaxID=2547429 RepID=UPI00105847B4|nr:methyltransferase domain-containing protein [Segetibacter sp. 3557_3]TDH24532.1 methyltransferase domain-containing protein [Segetibacter sp. 3557_3]
MKAFLNEALKNMRQTGSLVESSVYLVDKMIEGIDFNQNLRIVELGAGTGIITKRLVKEMNEDSTLAAYEINNDLFSKLQENEDKRLTLFNEDVTTIEQHFAVNAVDYVISGLPLANIEAEKKTSILHACHKVIRPGGFYIQFQYSRKDLSLLKEFFPKVDARFTLLNLPPAFVYYAQKED